MKVLLYNENNSSNRIHRAVKEQAQSLKAVEADFVEVYDDSVEHIHVNATDIKTRNRIKKFKKQGMSISYQANTNQETFMDTLPLSNIFAPLYGKYLMASYDLADRLIVATEHGRDQLRRMGYVKDIDIVPTPIDMKQYAYDPEKVEQFREYFQIDPSRSLVVSSGNTYERKGLLDFFNVARALPDIQFIWFGSVLKDFVPLKIRQALKKVPSNVIMAGHIAGNIFEGAVSAADVYFYPSYDDMEVDGVLEAMASSTQVLVRDIPVYRPWLVDQESCYMGDTNDDFVALIRASIIGKLPGTQLAAYRIVERQSFDHVGKLMLNTFEKIKEAKNNEED